MNDGLPDGNQTATIVASAAGHFAGQDSLVVLDGQIWQNARMRYDVNGDSAVTPLDALVLIHDINENGSRVLPPRQPPEVAVPPYFDVSGDGGLSPIDVLEVIHYINSGGKGEGESSVPRSQQEPPSAYTGQPALRAAATLADPASVGTGSSLADFEAWSKLALKTTTGVGQPLVQPPPALGGGPNESARAGREGDVFLRRRRHTARDLVFAQFADAADDDLLVCRSTDF